MPQDPQTPPAAPPLARAVLVYSALRVGLFLLLAALLLALGATALAALVGALLGSLLGSLVLLRRQRDDLAAALVARSERSRARRAHEQEVREHVARVRRDGAGPSGPGAGD